MFTWGEIEAGRLLLRAGEISRDNRVLNFHEAGNRLIALAERIKAERAVAAMEPVAIASYKAGKAT